MNVEDWDPRGQWVDGHNGHRAWCRFELWEATLQVGLN